MHRPTLGIGLLVLILMCLVPPVEPGGLAGNVAQAVGGTEIQYRPLWEVVETNQEGGALISSQIATTRLLLQVVVVGLVTAAVAYMVGPAKRD